MTLKAPMDQTLQVLGFIFKAILAIVLGFGISYPLWDFLVIPLPPTVDIVGPLPLQSIDPKTNIVRLCALVFLPLIIFLALIRKRRLPSMKSPKGSQPSRPFQFAVGFVSVAFIAILLARCLWVVIPVGSLDFFHEGELLVPAFNLLSGHGLWAGSYFIHGLFYDLYATLVSWKIFGHETVGAMRVGHQFWAQATELVIPIMVGSLLLNLFGRFNDKRFWAGLFVIISLYYTYLDHQNFDRRDLPLLLGVSFLSFGHHFKNPILFFLAGLMSATTYFVVIDRGAYYNAFLLAFVAVNLFKRDFLKVSSKNLIALGAGFLVSWLAFVSFVGKTEFLAFIDTTLSFYREKDYFDAYLLSYPLAFESKAWALYSVRLTSSILGVLVVLCLWRDSLTTNQRFTFLTLGILSFFYSRSGIARSDSGHLAYSAAFCFILAVTLSLWFSFLNQKVRDIIFYLSFLMIVSNGLYLFGKLDQRHFIGSAVVADFVAQPDEHFLESSQRMALQELKTEFQGESCVFNLSITEPVWPFLLKKPSCSRYFVPWFISARKRQEEYLTTIMERSPKVILLSGSYWGDSIDQISSIERLSHIHDQLTSEYATANIADAWKVYRRRL